MEAMGAIALTVAVGALGAWAATKKKVPAGAMIGALVLSAVFQIVTNAGVFPVEMKQLIQTVTGAFIGMKITRNELPGFRLLFKPIVMMLSGMIVLTLFLGFSLYFLFGMDLPTALLSCVPGGVADTTLMSADLHANQSTVAVIQSFRLIFVLTMFPMWIQWLSARMHVSEKKEAEVETVQVLYNGMSGKVHVFLLGHRYLRIFLTLVIACAGAAFGQAIQAPAGALTFSMLFTAIYNVFFGSAVIPVSYRRVAQTGAGILVGVGITMHELLQMQELLLPLLLIMTGYLLFNAGISWLLSKTTVLSFKAALFATSPAGASDMALIAADLDASISPAQVTILQLARLCTVLTVYPVLLAWILTFFGY